MLHSFVALLALISQGQAPASALPASPVARIVVTPRPKTVIANDTVQIRAEALDAAGRPVANARLIYLAGGAGGMDSTGRLFAPALGKIPVTISAIVPGTRVYIERFVVLAVPGPAVSVAVTPRVEKMAAGQRLRLTATSLSRVNDQRTGPYTWRSSNPAVLRIDTDGVLRAVVPGTATITASDAPATASMRVTVIPAASVASVTVTPERLDARTGDVIRLRAVAKDRAGREIAGLTPSWSISPGHGQIEPDGAFVGYEQGRYTVTASLGAQSADAILNLTKRDVRRPSTIVGRLARTAFLTSEVWIHPGGKVAYLGTHGGGDRIYTIDISNPAAPVVVDSIQANTRLVNDMMTTPDGNTMVFTREGAADRRNGIVIADTRDPLHPKMISEFTDGVTAGVHSAFVYRQEKYGTHVYLTNDGTGALHVIDISDPYKPKEVAQWTTPRVELGRYVHDIDVQNGLLYASYWNDGLVILDIGNGVRGGSPSHPVMVSQFKYDLDEMYRDVETMSSPGFGRGTHTAWRYKDYVFIADEVYRNGPVKGAKDGAADRMYGRLQVIDVKDIEHPKSVAWYEPEYGGVHNVWVAGDTLYMGAYNAGFRAFDISGELRGDLRAQGREITHVHTADLGAVDNVKNDAMTWGVVRNPKDGLLYVNDYHNGLWIVRIEPKPLFTP